MDIQGKTAIVTGAGRGVGRALALEFARNGANVVCAARREQEILQTVRLIEADGGAALAVAADVTQTDQVDRLVAQTLERFGRVHVLFNNAGSYYCIGPIGEVDPNKWWHDVTVNLLGTMLCCRAVLPHMIEHDEGIVINMLGGDRMPGGTGYSCSKVAIPRFTELLAKELEIEGTSVLCLGMGPGLVKTEMTQFQVDSPEGLKWVPSTKESFEQGNHRPPEDCAVTTMQLLGIACSALNGRCFGAGHDMEQVERELTQ